MGALPGQARRVSQRIPTGFISEDVTIMPPPDERSISFSAQVVSVDAASKACTGPSRDIRERTPTGHIQDVQLDAEDRSVKFGDDVSFLQAASAGALPGQARRVSERIPTGFISEDVTTAARLDERGISFSAQVEAVDAASKEKSVKFGNDVSLLQAASMGALPGQARRAFQAVQPASLIVTKSFLERTRYWCWQDAAGEAVLDARRVIAKRKFLCLDVPACVDCIHALLEQKMARTVSFRPAAEISLVEFDHGAVSDEDVKVKRKLPLKSVRDRQQTSWAPSLPSDEKSVRFKDLPTSPLGKRTGSPDPPSASKSDSQTTDANTASTKSRGSEGSRGRGSEDDPPSDAETVSSASSRNPRSRMTTPFMSAVDWGYEVSAPKEATQAGAAGAVAAAAAGDSVPSSNRRRRSKPSSLEPYSSATDRNLVKQVSIESSIEREITERVKLNVNGSRWLKLSAKRERNGWSKWAALMQMRIPQTQGSPRSKANWKHPCEYRRAQLFLNVNGAKVPLALERCSSADGGNPEADLANHIATFDDDVMVARATLAHNVAAHEDEVANNALSSFTSLSVDDTPLEKKLEGMDAALARLMSKGREKEVTEATEQTGDFVPEVAASVNDVSMEGAPPTGDFVPEVGPPSKDKGAAMDVDSSEALLRDEADYAGLHGLEYDEDEPDDAAPATAGLGYPSSSAARPYSALPSGTLEETLFRIEGFPDDFPGISKRSADLAKQFTKEEIASLFSQLRTETWTRPAVERVLEVYQIYKRQIAQEKMLAAHYNKARAEIGHGKLGQLNPGRMGATLMCPSCFADWARPDNKAEGKCKLCGKEVIAVDKGPPTAQIKLGSSSWFMFCGPEGVSWHTDADEAQKEAAAVGIGSWAQPPPKPSDQSGLSFADQVPVALRLSLAHTVAKQPFDEDWQPSQETRAFHPQLAAAMDIEKKKAGAHEVADAPGAAVLRRLDRSATISKAAKASNKRMQEEGELRAKLLKPVVETIDTWGPQLRAALEMNVFNPDTPLKDVEFDDIVALRSRSFPLWRRSSEKNTWPGTTTGGCLPQVPLALRPTVGPYWAKPLPEAKQLMLEMRTPFFEPIALTMEEIESQVALRNRPALRNIVGPFHAKDHDGNFHWQKEVQTWDLISLFSTYGSSYTARHLYAVWSHLPITEAKEFVLLHDLPAPTTEFEWKQLCREMGSFFAAKVFVNRFFFEIYSKLSTSLGQEAVVEVKMAWFRSYRQPPDTGEPSAGSGRPWDFPSPTEEWVLLKADVSKAHRRIKVLLREWRYQVAQLGEEWWVNTVELLNYAVFPEVDWGFVFVDDFAWLLRKSSSSLLASSLCLLMLSLGTPLSWKKTLLAEVNTWLGFVIDPKGPCVQMARDKHLLVIGILEELKNGKVMSASQIARRPGKLIRALSSLLLSLFDQKFRQASPYAPLAFGQGPVMLVHLMMAVPLWAAGFPTWPPPESRTSSGSSTRSHLGITPGPLDKGCPKKRIAALEMFGTLILAHFLMEKAPAFIPNLRIPLVSDNQGNVYSLLNDKSKKMPTSVILMEILLQLHVHGMAPGEDVAASRTGFSMDGTNFGNLAFFETFDDDALHCLIEDICAVAMEVYEFQHSEKVVRQGDTDGTHFFVVAQGEFCVLKDNNPHCYIGPGTSFGESVLLLFGERNATVCARGCARAYGMEGMQVRELLSKQYEQMRRSVVEATDEVLKSNLCEILSGLNGYELQSLYDQVEMRSFEEGDTILSEGDSPKEVLILYSGQVESWKDAQDVEAVPRFHLMGDYALPFKDEVLFEQPTNLRAATPVEPAAYTAFQRLEDLIASELRVLVLKRSLLDNIFGDQLQQVLVKHRVLHVLAKHQDFSRLHQEHREAIAVSCQIRCLGEGSEQSWEDVRMIVALNGEIELRLETGPQHLIGAASDLFAIPYEQQKTSLQLKALGDSKLAVWQREDLGSILAFDDFDGALEQDNKVRSLRSVFIFATLSKQQLQRLANALQIQIVRSGKRVFSQGDQGTHFYIIRKGAVSVEIDGRMKRRLGDPDYFGERALLGSEIRSASITALEDTELWKMGKETFQEMMQGPCLDYLKDRISLQDTNLTFQDLEFVRVIGRGGFGVVKMVRAKKTGVRYALKCVRKRDVVEKNVQDALVSELSILKEVDHPFIIKFVRSFRNESRVYFLMELVSGGELLDALDALGLLKYSQALFYTGCIVLALEFLHSRRIAYLDLKSENCLIDQQGYLKMIDFGIARRITNTRYGPLKGTPMFMAPEMILGKGHTTVADLWSLGICLYEFVIGHFPFASNCSNHGQIFHQILRAELRFPEWFDKQPMADEIISLIRGLLTRDPKKRLGAGHEGYTKLKAHPFFKHLCWEKLLGREQEPPFAPTSETYAEDKERSAGLQAVGDSLPTVEEEEVRCAMSEDPWEDPAPGWDADF
ncbi:PRKG1 [Symbiodinium sp. CCMP2456]|nr:PRKG1 [Symbiodinium sp. CCMP2456]